MRRSSLADFIVSGVALATALFGEAGFASEQGLAPSAHYPSVSPDGRKLVFVSDVNGSRDLWISDATGANAAVLTPWANSDEKQPAWAPDGSHIIFSSTRGSSKHHIWVIAPSGSNAMQLTFDDAEHEQPRYSPRGSSILYISNGTGKRELWVMNADGSGQQPIALSGTRVSDPGWSPDGRKIVYVGCVRGGACNLFLINADGSGSSQITSGSFQDWTPDWGTAGIVFASSRGNSQGLWLVQADGAGLQQVTTPDRTADLDPRWVGSGTAFVFSRSGKSPADAASDIWAVASLGATPQRVTRLPSAIETLLKSFNLPKGTHNSLGVKLEHVLTSIDAGALKNACNHLRAFTNEVTAQSGKRLTLAQADQLLAAADQIRMTLGCK